MPSKRNIHQRKSSTGKTSRILTKKVKTEDELNFDEQLPSSSANNRQPPPLIGLEAIHMQSNVAFADFFMQNYSITLPQSIDAHIYMNAFRAMILIARDRSLIRVVFDRVSNLIDINSDDRDCLLALRQLSTTTDCVVDYLQRQCSSIIIDRLNLPNLIDTRRKSSSSVDCECCLQQQSTIQLELSGYRLNLITMSSIGDMQFELQLINVCTKCAKLIRLLHRLRFIFIDQMQLTIRRVTHRMVTSSSADRNTAEQLFIDDYTNKTDRNFEERYWHQLRCLFDEAEHFHY